MTRTCLEIPRSTCRLFGTIKALSTVKKSAILVHGPKGCVYHINYILGMRGDRPSAIYSTSLGEHDVIFGAEDRLADAIGELDRRLSPDLIFVLSCCASSIIGEDVESACRAAETRARVISFPAGGFEGDHHTAYEDTLTRLVSELAGPPGEVRPCSVNLVGMLRGGPDLRELKRVLSLAGIGVVAVLPADASCADLGRLGEAALNIVICEPAGKAAAELLEQRFGTPFIVVDFPVGARAARSFLERVTAALGVPMPPGCLDGGQGQGPLPGTPAPPLRVAIVGGPTRAIPMARYLADLGLDPVLLVLDFVTGTGERLAGLAIPGLEVLVEPSQEELEERVRALRVELLVGGMAERPVAAMLGIAHIDMMHGSQRTACFTGERELARAVARVQASRSPEPGQPGDS